jgi:glyoxylase-like metal-dependent hydrolase (beta-lactamase superfamily II)
MPVRFLFLAMLMGCWGISAPASADSEDPVLEEVAPGLYRYVAGNYRSMVWVEKDGIAVLDTLNSEAAGRLKTMLADRFDVPVRYVVYSHNHFDHAYGGEIFDDPATVFVAHEDAYRDLRSTRARTVLPDLTFEEKARLRMGGETLTMRYHGANNGRGSISMLFEQARLLYVVDWIVVGRLPYQDLKGYDIHGVISSTREVLDLDWDIFVGGHAEVGDRAGVERYLAYLETLYAEVRDGMLAGKSLETLQAEITLDAFADIPMFEEWRAQNIAGVYDTLSRTSYMLMRPEVGEPSTSD